MIHIKPPYTLFAQVYDRTMNDIPYHHWAYFLFQIFEEHKICQKDWVVDIGAGTGIVASKLNSYYNLISLDNSSHMLKKASRSQELKCIQADMQNLPFLEDKISAAYSTHDCLNYLTTDREFHNHLSEVYRILKPGGIYIFDYSTEYNVLQNFKNKVFRERHGNYRMVWTNTYNEQEQMVTSIIDVTEYMPFWAGFLLFWKNKKFREIHRQKIFSEINLDEFYTKTGFELIEKNYDYKGKKPDHRAQILVYILRKPG